jgi:hypothetical protein
MEFEDRAEDSVAALLSRIGWSLYFEYGIHVQSKQFNTKWIFSFKKNCPDPLTAPKRSPSDPLRSVSGRDTVFPFPSRTPTGQFAPWLAETHKTALRRIGQHGYPGSVEVHFKIESPYPNNPVSNATDNEAKSNIREENY